MIKELYIDQFIFEPIDVIDNYQNVICDVFNNVIKIIVFDLHNDVYYIDFRDKDDKLYCAYTDYENRLILTYSSILCEKYIKDEDDKASLRDILKFKIECVS